MSKMTDEEYTVMQSRLMLLGAFANDLGDVSAFIERINEAESLAPILNPSLYQQGAAKLEIIKRVAIAARAFQKAMPTREEAIQVDGAQELWGQVHGGKLGV